MVNNQVNNNMGKEDIKQDKILIFDIKGPMAHFRKYYTNSSSLTYTFPPRTVIVGLIAGLLGLPNEKSDDKDNIYYEKFCDENYRVAISLRTNVRKIMQTENYIKTKTDNSSKYSFEALITGTRGSPTQIPLEVLLPEDGDEIIYRIYFFYLDNERDKFYQELKKRLENKMFVYPSYFGITEFLATIDYIGEGKIIENKARDVEIKTICKLEEINPVFENSETQYLIEKMPTGFSKDRTPKKPREYLFEMKNKSLKAKLKENNSCCLVNYNEKGVELNENIMFL